MVNDCPAGLENLSWRVRAHKGARNRENTKKRGTRINDMQYNIGNNHYNDKNKRGQNLK